MNIYIYDTSFNCLGVVDKYESFIWAERYSSAGDFEIYAPMSNELYDLLAMDRYVMIKESDKVMIIENSEVITNLSDGDRLKVTGRSYESVLDRRIIQTHHLFDNQPFQTIIKTLINENVINAENARKIPGISFLDVDDPIINSIRVTTEYLGEGLYESIKSLCEANDIGFRMDLKPDNTFEFKLFTGTDRSYDQSSVPYIIFSSKYGNLINSSYVKTFSKHKNVAFVKGDVWNAVAGDTSKTGFYRREAFVDATSISREDDQGNITPYNTYQSILLQKGKEALSDYTIKSVEAFSADIETVNTFKYGQDYFIGDILQVVNKYGFDVKVRVTEYIISDEDSGFSCYPTFTAVMEEE